MTMDGATRFGAVLRRLRLNAGLTQEALAERAGLSAKAIRGLERDPTRVPRFETVALLADALALDPTARAHFLAAARPEGGPAGAPPALPRPLTPLIGREGVVRAVVELLGQGAHPLVMLTGPGGVGKTRLAVAAAERVAGEFADGAVFVDLAPLRDPSLVLPTVAQRLGLDERDATALTERLTAYLSRKRMLLVLDNLEHLVDARGAILNLLESCPGLVVLATSRAALRIRGERAYRVAPLELPSEDAPPEELARVAAAALFVERARAVGVELEPDAATARAVAAICRRLDGLPLAIELAAAWTRLVPPPALLARLERRLPLLVGGAHDLPARQRTMRDAIAWSYDLLDAPQQRLFRQLAVFVGGCTMEAAAEVGVEPAPGTTPAPADTLAHLVMLVDRSFLRREDGDQQVDTEPRLTWLETVREYGLELLEEHGEVDAARARHAAHYLALAEAAASSLRGPDGLAWRARLAREHDNVRSALGWVLGRGEGTHALRLAGALAGFWSERGHLSEGRRWLHAALATGAGSDETVVRARCRALVGAATLAIEQAAYAEAADLLAQAVALAPDQGHERVAALNARGALARARGQYDIGRRQDATVIALARARGQYAEAARDHEAAHALAVAVGDPVGAAVALQGLASAMGFTGDTVRASALAEQVVVAFRALGDARGLAEAVLGVMWYAMNAADYARLEALGAEALALFRAVGDTGRLAEALFVLGVAAQLEGRHEHATALHIEGLALRRARGDERGAVEQLTALAQSALQQGNAAQARDLLEETLATLQQYDDPWIRALSLTLLTHVELAAGKVARARTLVVESAGIYRAIGNLLYVPWCLEGLAGVAAAQGAWVRAAQLCGARDALRIRLASPMPPCHAEGYARTLASVRTALGEQGFAAAHAVGTGLTPDAALAMLTPSTDEGKR